MLQLPGGSALSAFRAQKLLERIQARLPEVQAIQARYVHFVDLEQRLSDEQQAQLERLLDDGSGAAAAAPGAAGGSRSLSAACR